jgi:hypothetical protein
MPQVSDEAPKFFPDEYKAFAYKEGDVLADHAQDDQITLHRILKIDRQDLQKFSGISIAGKAFVAPIDDWLLIISILICDRMFNSFDEARAYVSAGSWSTKVHVPMRAPGAGRGTLVGNIAVRDSEFGGYNYWRTEFAKGKAGIF